MEIKYTEEILKFELMHLMDYTEGQVDRLIEFYRRNNEFDDLIALIETKHAQ